MERGQAHTLEAFMASIVLLSGVVFALQGTAVTPLTASTSSQHIGNQQGAVADGVLGTARAEGTLVHSLLYWNESGGRFHGGTVNGAYGSGGPPTPFGALLNRTFLSRGVAFDVTLYYLREGGSRRDRTLVDLGAPSDNAAVVTRTVTLYDGDRLYTEGDAAGRPTGSTLENASFYAPDMSPDSPVYNVVVVEVVVWRM